MPNSSDFFVTGDVGGGYGQSRPHDVVRVRRALHETGYGRSPDNPSTRYDKSIHDNIVGFQDDFGLEKDGWLKPGGPTELAMNLALDAKRAGGDGAMDAFRAPFATLNKDGFKYLHDSFRLAERPESWVDSDDNRLSDARRDDIIFSRTTGRRIKRIPPNDPDLDFDQPNPVAPLAKSVFGDRIMAATPTRLKTQPESQPAPPAAMRPKAEPAPTQIVQATPASQPAQTGATQPASSAGPIMPIPIYREEAIGRQRNSWRDWSNSVKQLPNLSATEEKAYMEIFAAEGGDSADASSSAVSGILQGTLDELAAKGYVKGVKPGVTPRQLSRQKRAEVYRGYVDYALKNAGGSAALNRVGNPEAGAALVDTLFMHGRGGGARLIQKAINDIIPKRVPVGDAVGNKTIEAYQSLVADPVQRQRLLDALAKQRLDLVRNDPDFKGKETRINHFRFQKSP